MRSRTPAVSNALGEQEDTLPVTTARAIVQLAWNFRIGKVYLLGGGNGRVHTAVNYYEGCSFQKSP